MNDAPLGPAPTIKGALLISTKSTPDSKSIIDKTIIAIKIVLARSLTNLIILRTLLEDNITHQLLLNLSKAMIIGNI